jgi:putative DNA primase/helicase
MDTRALDEAIERACTMQRSRPTLVLDAARDYVERGLRPVPLPLTVKSKGKDPDAGKGCYLNGWPTLRITETQIAQYFSGPVNVGVVLGNGLVDIDLDCREAIDLSDKYLLPTNSIFGRASKPRSHRLYQCDGVAPTRTFRDPITGDMIVELRGDMKNGQPGMQTVMPGSIHVKSGERIEWVEDGECGCVAYAALHRRVVQLAVGVLFTRYYQVAPDDDAQFQQVLAKADPLISKRIAQWQRELDGASARAPSPPRPSPGEPPTVGQPTLLLPTEHEVARLYTALTYTNSRDRNEIWLPFGGAIHDLPWPEDLRRALWDRWSWHMDPAPENAKKFDEGDQDKTWTSFARGYQGTPATVGSIFKRALDAGWDGHALKPLPDEIKALVPPPVEVPDEGITPEERAEIDRLARLPTWQYEKQRKDAAKKFKVRLDLLDAAVEQTRRRIYGDEEDDTQQGQALNFVEPEPWPEPVDGYELVRAIGSAIRYNVVLAPEYLLILALWVLHTYLLEELKCTPRLIIRAATEGSGKTLLMTLLRYLVWRPLKSINMSPAALYRSIDKYKPVLLFDEASRTFEAEHGTARETLDAIIAILDAGFEPGDSVVRAAGEDNDVRQFFVHSPVALAVLKKTKLPRTLVSRSIYIPLKKKLKSEWAVPFSRYHDIEPLQKLAQKARRWSEDNREQLRALLIARIERERANAGVVDDASLTNRLADKWRPLFAIAEATGLLSEVQYVADCLTKLDAMREEDASDLRGVLLLADCKRMFEEGNISLDDWISPLQISIHLNQLNERPWGSMGRGITPHKVVTTLAEFDIFTQRPSTREARKRWDHRGYQRAQFEEAWRRYLA